MSMSRKAFADSGQEGLEKLANSETRPSISIPILLSVTYNIYSNCHVLRSFFCLLFTKISGSMSTFGRRRAFQGSLPPRCSRHGPEAALPEAGRHPHRDEQGQRDRRRDVNGRRLARWAKEMVHSVPKEPQEAAFIAQAAPRRMEPARVYYRCQ